MVHSQFLGLAIPALLLLCSQNCEASSELLDPTTLALGCPEPIRILVHGVPDTSAVWEPVINVLEESADDPFVNIALDLPGFGPEPRQGIETAEDYLEWLVETISDLLSSCEQQSKVDVVGHDWGGILVWGLVNHRPDLVSRWTVIAAPVYPGFRWYLLAVAWRTPILGEVTTAFMTQLVMTIALSILGVPLDWVVPNAGELDQRMKRSILSLYRSAPDSIGEQWFKPDQLETDSGLLLYARKDPFMSADEAVQFGEQIGVRSVKFRNLAHWLILEDPERIVEEILMTPEP